MYVASEKKILLEYGQRKKKRKRPKVSIPPYGERIRAAETLREEKILISSDGLRFKRTALGRYFTREYAKT